MPNETSILQSQCEGWWEQQGLGRQTMQELTMQFAGGRVSGSGHDVVGVFTFAGTIGPQGQVAMVKQYLGQHTVDYVGTYDGEGLLQGEWDLGWASRGRWLIWIKKAGSNASDIAEWMPAEVPTP
jgi:hypothetical protein